MPSLQWAMQWASDCWLVSSAGSCPALTPSSPSLAWTRAPRTRAKRAADVDYPNVVIRSYDACSTLPPCRLHALVHGLRCTSELWRAVCRALKPWSCLLVTSPAPLGRSTLTRRTLIHNDCKSLTRTIESSRGGPGWGWGERVHL